MLVYMELRHLVYFKMVAEELHFRNAAAKLFISQPPLSRQIRELEEELGAVLFERNNKRVALTPAGAYFKVLTDEILSRLNEGKQVVRQLHENLSGELKIGYISSTGQSQLMTVLHRMHEVFPFLKVKLYEVPTVKQVAALEEGKLDIGIMRAPVGSEKLEVTSLFRDGFIAVTPPGWPQPEGPEAIGPLLKQGPFIFFNSDYAPVYHQKLVEICHRLGFVPAITHEANTVHSILQLVAHGAGISILPASLYSQVQALGLSCWALAHLPVDTEIVMVCRKDKNEAVTLFVENYLDFFKSSTI